MKIDKRNDTILLTVNFPLWLRVFFAIGGPLVMLPICITLINTIRDELTFFAIFKGGFLTLVVGSTGWAVLVLFSKIYATQSGIQRRGLLGSRQTLTWDEIKTVAKPRLGFPGDAAYIVSKSGKKMTVARSMTGYSELLRLIQEKAPEVKLSGLPENLLPSNRANSLRGILIFLALFLAYVIIRKLTGW